MHTRRAPHVLALLAVALLLTPRINATESAQTALALLSENTVLYRNVDAEYTMEFHYPAPAGPASTKDDYPIKRVDNVQTSWQGELYHCQYEESVSFRNGNVRRLLSYYGYDGTTTRLNENGAIGNVSDARVGAYPWCAPHLFGFPEFGEVTPSDLAACNARKRAVAALDRIASVRAKVLNESLVGSVTCTCIELLTLDDKGAPIGRINVFLAPSRNWLPARTERFMGKKGSELLNIPVSEFEVVEWREPQPKVWVPSKVVGKNYNGGVLANNATLELKRIAFDVNHGKEFFSNVTMPSAGIVYHIKGGQIVRSERLNGKGVEPPKTRPRWPLWATIATVTLLAIVGLVVRYVRR